jgi:hypothetical protein
MENEDPRKVASKIDNELPTRLLPNKDREDPNRRKDRKETALPRSVMSIMLTE